MLILVGVQMTAILAKLSSSSRQALTVTAWSSSSAFWHTRLSKLSIYSADHWTFRVKRPTDWGGLVDRGQEGGRKVAAGGPTSRQPVRQEQVDNGR